MSAVPTIETARLRLRAFRQEDLSAHARMLGDMEVVRFLGASRPYSREDAWRRLAAAGGMWPLLGYGYWAVEPLDGSGYLGLIGFADFKRDIAPAIEGVPEIGWIFLPEAQGRGMAREAGQAALAWADRTLSARETVAIIDPGNDRSIRLARRLGFDEGRRARYGEDSVLLFRRASPAAASTAAAAAAGRAAAT